MKNIVLVLVTIMLVLLMNEKAFADEEIYFDEEGNLIYITYDKKATSSVSYKAIGWILKRYDAPIDATGQQYVIVRKIEYAVEDPENPAYLYCYFWSDRDEILGAVGKVSAEWRRQLEKYGDTIYIDNVMTVCNSKVPLGNVDVNGNCTGEVYFTLAGIQGARPWARPEFLESYFDIKLKFPIQTKTPSISYGGPSAQLVSYSSEVTGDMSVGSYEEGNEEYDVSQAMPSGEKVYFSGECTGYKYELSCIKYTIEIQVPVKVGTTYIRNWVDTSGKSQSETLTVYRWYLVPKTVTYNTISAFSLYNLQSVAMTSALLNGQMTVYSNWGKIPVVKRVYGDVQKHTIVPTFSCNSGTVVLSSGDFRKPAIPETDYSSVAKKANTYVMVRSDYLVVNGQVILADSYGSNKGSGVNYITPGVQQVYLDKVDTYKLCSNGLYDDIVMLCSYKEQESGKVYTYVNQDINSVNIHTPVVCTGKIYGDKSINQAVMPSYSDLVLGGDVVVSIDYTGTHNDYKGYGTRNYSEYVGSSYVRFEFPIIDGCEEIPAGQWISVEPGINTFKLPDTVKQGSYTVECKAVAVNGYESAPLGQGYNAKMDEYGAYSSFTVSVIGRMYDFEVNDNGCYVAGGRDRDGIALKDFVKSMLPDSFSAIEKKTVDLSITTLGDLSDNTKLEGAIKYYYLGESSEELIPVDLYEIGSGLYSEQINKAGSSIIFESADCEDVGNNTYVWHTSYKLPYNVVPVKYGMEIDDYKSLMANYLKKGTVFVVFDFTLENEGAKSLSYINESNFKRGYCNMWRQQGGVQNLDISGKIISVKDGTAFMTRVGSGIKYDYEVNGTH